MSLSERLRPEVEAAPWVIEEVKKLEEELDAAWMAVDLVKKENARYQNALEKITGFTESDFMGKWASEYDLIKIARNALDLENHINELF